MGKEKEEGRLTRLPSGDLTVPLSSGSVTLGHFRCT